MAVNTSSGFFDLLQQSELLSDEQLAEARELAGDSDSPKDAARTLIKHGLLTNWQGSMLVNGRTNMHLGKYRLLDQVSTSEMGHVFHAEHTQMGRHVALRVLSKLQTKDPQAIKRFLAEAQQIAALDHRNLIHVYDVDSEGERYYLVSEFVDGEDLQKRVERDGPLPPEQAARYIRQAALGLAHAHEQDIVHGDVKPSNLLIDAQDSIRVLDVGVARIAQENGKLAEDQIASKFRAPEQVAGESYDRRADIYSLGRTLYFLLTGKVALSKDSGADVGLLKICQKMVARNPDQRLASAEEVAAALEEWLEKNQDVAADSSRGGGSREKKDADSGNGAKRKPPVKPTNPRIAIALPDGDSLAGPLDVGDSSAGSQPATPQKPKLPQQKPASTSLASKRGGVPPWAFLAGAGALVALMLLVGIGVGAYMIFAPSGGEEVAANDDASQAAALDPSDPEYVDPEAVDPEAVDPEAADPEAVDPEAVNAEAADPEAAEADADADGGQPETTSAADGDDGQPQDGPDKNGGADGAEQPSDDGNGGGAATVASTAGGASPPAETPAPTTPEPEEPPKAETPKPEPKEPATPPKKEEPEKPAPPQNPFRNLAQQVALPPLDTSDEPATGAFDPKPLGDLFVKPGELFFINLQGGDTAYTGTRTFTLVPNYALNTERDWDIVLSRGASDDLKIAALSVKDDKLLFQWKPEAKEDVAAPNFANCLLSMRTGIHNHWMTLRVPKEVPPMEFELSKTTSRVDFQIEAAPQADRLMVEIAALEGFPEQVAFDPEQAIGADGESTFVRFGEPPAQVLSLKMDTKLRGGIRAGVQVTATAHYKLEGMPRDERFVEKEFQNFRNQVNARYQSASAFVTGATKQLQNIKGKNAKQQKDALSRQILLAQQTVTQGETQLKQLEQVDAQLKQFQPVGKIHFRVYINAGEYQIDLIRSNSLPKPAPAKEDKKPAAKGNDKPAAAKGGDKPGAAKGGNKPAPKAAK
jgi:serine/threonine protein kinase